MPLSKRPCAAPSPIPRGEDAARSWPSMNRKLLDLGLSSLQNCAVETSVVYKPLSLWSLLEQPEWAETHPPSQKLPGGSEREPRGSTRASDPWWRAWLSEVGVLFLVSHWLSLSPWMLSVLHYSWYSAGVLRLQYT